MVLTTVVRQLKSARYHNCPKAFEPEELEIKHQLKYGVIEHFDSGWALPVLIASKTDGRLRICVDYRNLNTLTIKHSYPIRHIDQ